MEKIRDLNELLPKVAELAEKLIAECKEQGLEIRITETYRSQERQNELYAQGRTKPGNIVTWAKISMHTSRKAFDIVPIVNGKVNYRNLSLFEKAGAIGIKLGLTWGGNWKTPDRPHFQYDGKIEEMTVGAETNEHWAKKYFTYLNKTEIQIFETRFDDKITRGEVFKLLALLKGFKE